MSHLTAHESPPPAAYTCNGAPVAASAFYAIACDPQRSVAIEACAGAGKTWMLVSRILRALLEGTKPESILAITYTKKAAGEMRERLYEWLHDFAYEEDDNRLIEELVNRGVSKQAAPDLLPQLRALHAQLLNQARSVEIRTFHSWFAQLLGAAPLGVLHRLGLPIQYDLIEDDSELFNPAWYALLQRCTQDDALKADLDVLLREQGTFNVQEALRSAWSRRVEFGLADEHGVLERSVADATDPSDELMHEPFKLRWLGYAKVLGQEKNKTPQKAAEELEYAFTSVTEPGKRLMALRHALFVKDDDRLNSNLKKFEAAQQAEIELLALLQQHTTHQAYIYQQRMTRLTRALLECYAQVKQEQKLVDMADLERVALHLLGDTETYGWVAQRLDARISQVLIDEFQDTNPLQWQALRGWLSAYGGAGGGGRMSVFIVGDPKQSIYRFRRADPSVFIAACDFLQHTLGGSKLACDHTWRNVAEVMSVVNAVFAKAQNAGEFEGFRHHTTAVKSVGRVVRLPMILREIKTKNNAQQEVPLWRDSLTEPRYLEEEKLRMQEIRQVANLIQTWLHEHGWQPADIKILSRRKDRLRELLLELNQRHIPWRFADDVHLIETLEVQDMVALLDVLSSPVNDLSLAQVLRSPIFNLDDEALMLLGEQVNLAQEKQLAEKALVAKQSNECNSPHIKTASPQTIVSWWNVLMNTFEGAVNDASDFAWPKSLRHAAKQLKGWKKLAQILPPHDLLDAIYNQADILNSYAKAVPVAMRESVLANLHSFLQQALTLNSGRYTTPYNFVRTMRRKGIKSAHSESSNTVELLTVHGAKGLEARGIIMLDTDPAATRAERLSVLMDWPAEKSAPTQFIFYINKKSLPLGAQVLVDKEEAADQREELNALYVAMTRAKEQLVFSALQVSGKGSNEGSWWHRLDNVDGVQELEVAAVDSKNMSAGVVSVSAKTLATAAIHTLLNTGPVANVAALEAFTQLVLPVYQKLEKQEGQEISTDVYDVLRAETGQQGVARATLATRNEQTQAQRFGNAVHRLLELESVEPELVHSVATEMGLTQQQSTAVVHKVQTIMQHPQSRRFFDKQSIEEVQKEVELSYQGKLLRIDRLVKIAGEWWVLDFKSASSPLGIKQGDSQQNYQEEYQKQLKEYKAVLSAIMPGATIHTALITGDGMLIEV